MNFYSIYNSRKETYGLPFLAEDDASAKEKIIHDVISSNDPYVAMTLPESSLYKVGVWDCNFGFTLDNGDHSMVFDDLAELDFPESYRVYLDKLLKKKEENTNA